MKKHQWVTLENNFHHTSCRVKAEEINGGHLVINMTQAKRARKKLCGMSDCTCGQDDLSQRGATSHVAQIITITTHFGTDREEVVELTPSEKTY